MKQGEDDNERSDVMTWIDWATVACVFYAALLSTLVAIRQQLRIRGERELLRYQQRLSGNRDLTPKTFGGISSPGRLQNGELSPTLRWGCMCPINLSL